MYFITGLLSHLKRIQESLARIEGEAFLNAKDLSMQVRANKRTLYFMPQFTFTQDGQIRYTPRFGPQVGGFCGWRPYLDRKWPLAGDKLAFKEFVAQRGLRTPAHWLAPQPGLENFLIKQRRASFGEGIRGPFRHYQPADAAQQLQPNEFYEAFVPGRIAKAWYWAGELVCLELRQPPRLQGDGFTTVARLAAQANRREVDPRALAWIAHYQERALNSVLPAGDSMVADFKYGSPYDQPSFTNDNVLPQHQGGAIAEQLAQAGRLLLEAVPQAMRGTTLFTLDAMVDAQDRVWLLEMNSNPMVHPDVYPEMMTRLFESAEQIMQSVPAPTA